jgi:hypothetical protein
MFPGYAVTSSFADGRIATYAPSLPEVALGVSGMGIAFLIAYRGARARFRAARRRRGGPRRELNALAGLLDAVPGAAAHKSSGKTTISVASAALRARGLAVQPFKKGPDYIDPMWLALASGRPCRNLDPWLTGEAEIRAAYARHAAGADVALVEGNKGLYDGLALDGSNSNAALAKLLDLPVVLVIDARGMTRGIAPLILGYQAFDRESSSRA